MNSSIETTTSTIDDSVKTIGAVTIGQTPRDDIVPELEVALGTRYKILQVGALDGLNEEEIVNQHRKFGGRLYVTRLRNGAEIRVREDFVSPRLKECLRSLQDRTDLILLLCTGDLPSIRVNCPVLHPGRILQDITRSLDVKSLGVLTPAAEQVKSQRKRWRRLVRNVVVSHVSPYGPLEAFETAAKELRPKRPDVVVMDCIGYTQQMKRIVLAYLDRPVLSASTLLAKVAAEILG